MSLLASMRQMLLPTPPHCRAYAVMLPTRPPPPMMLTFMGIFRRLQVCGRFLDTNREGVRRTEVACCRSLAKVGPRAPAAQDRHTADDRNHADKPAHAPDDAEHR